MKLLLNIFFQRILFCVLFCFCQLSAKAQNIWKLYCNTKEIQIRSYTSKGQLRYLVQNDDDANKIDSVVYKDRIHVYSFAGTKFRRNTCLGLVNFYSKFELHNGSFLSPYVRHVLLLEEYIADLQSIYESFLPDGDEVSSHVSISGNRYYTKIDFRNLECQFNRLFSPVVLQSYLSDNIIKNIEVYIKYGKLSKISYILDRNILNIVFSYECNSIKILIESLFFDGRKDEFVYKWKSQS